MHLLPSAELLDLEQPDYLLETDCVLEAVDLDNFYDYSLTAMPLRTEDALSRPPRKSGKGKAKAADASKVTDMDMEDMDTFNTFSKEKQRLLTAMGSEERLYAMADAWGPDESTMNTADYLHEREKWCLKNTHNSYTDEEVAIALACKNQKDNREKSDRDNYAAADAAAAASAAAARAVGGSGAGSAASAAL